MSSTLLSPAPNLGCGVHLPKAFKGADTHSSATSAPVKTYPVSSYPACPSHWLHGDPKHNEISHVFAAKPDHGLWLDFNTCFAHNHDVAILISIQGINPLTGRPTTNLKLEKQDSAPFQNYLSTAGCPHGLLRLDGFLSETGKVRQYLLTTDHFRGIATQILGENRAASIGIAFFLSKNPKPKQEKQRPPEDHIRDFLKKRGNKFWEEIPVRPNPPPSEDLHPNYPWYPQDPTWDPKRGFNPVWTCGSLSHKHDQSTNPKALLDVELKQSKLENLYAETRYHNTPELPQNWALEELPAFEIAAGSKISQQIYQDPNPLEYWETSPCAKIFLQWTSPEHLAQILSQGEIGANTEGALAGLKVGN
jgi:hypothetical protein